jgi:Domain of unknown function (DUF4160)
MVAIINENGLRVMIYANDHRPAHVHIWGAGFEIVALLNCPVGPLEEREVKGDISKAGVRKVLKSLQPKVSEMCKAWRKQHGRYH